MKKIWLMSLVITQILLGDNIDEQRIGNLPDIYNKTNAFMPTIQIGTTRYNFDIKGIFFDRSINYDVLEGTFGLSYNAKSWTLSSYLKNVIKEIQTNSFVALTGESDDANIERQEWIVSLTYKHPSISKLFDTSRFSSNLMYFNSKLDAENSYRISNDLNKRYNYGTEGVNASLTYTFAPTTNGSVFFTRLGLLYTQVELNFREYKNGIEQNRFVDDNVDSWGVSFGAGYNWRLDSNLKVSLFTDWNSLDFGEIDISEKNQGVLTQNSFIENTLSFNIGISYSFH